MTPSLRTQRAPAAAAIMGEPSRALLVGLTLSIGTWLSGARRLEAQAAGPAAPATTPTRPQPPLVPASHALPSASSSAATPCVVGAAGAATGGPNGMTRATTTPCAPATAAAVATPTRAATTMRRPAGRRTRRATRAERPAARPASAIAPRRQVPGARPVSAAQLLDAATREYRETGVARPVVLGAVTAFPYGVSDAVVTCGVLRACLIDLEPGERLVTKPLAGDMKPGGRWFVGTAPVGADSASTLVWVKPTDCGLTTNLVLSTDRRVYTLTLESPACERGGRGPAAHVTFYFPDSTVPGAVPPSALAGTVGAPGEPGWSGGTARGLTPAFAAARGGSAARGASAEGASLAGIVVDVARLNFDYRVRRQKRFPWAPAQVFDDAVHTFIKIPPEAAAHAAPALFELSDGGGKTLMNYTVRDGFYVVDRTFRRAVLSLGQGKHEQRVELENARFGTPVYGPAVPSTPHQERE